MHQLKFNQPHNSLGKSVTMFSHKNWAPEATKLRGRTMGYTGKKRTHREGRKGDAKGKEKWSLLSSPWWSGDQKRRWSLWSPKSKADVSACDKVQRPPSPTTLHCQPPHRCPRPEEIPLWASELHISKSPWHSPGWELPESRHRRRNYCTSFINLPLPFPH